MAVFCKHCDEECSWSRFFDTFWCRECRDDSTYEPDEEEMPEITSRPPPCDHWRIVVDGEVVRCQDCKIGFATIDTWRDVRNRLGLGVSS